MTFPKDTPSASPYAAIEAIFRSNRGRVLASLISYLGDFDLAEDALQDASIAAMQAWRRDGVPPNPIGWLTVTARRKAIDQLRRRKRLHQKLAHLGDLQRIESESQQADMDQEYPDERLKLIFTNCHPAIPRESQIALTLHTLGGLSTEEIARGFLVSKETLAQRLVRAKRKLRDAGIPYRVPPVHLLPERIDAVLLVIYLIFNEGYQASGGASLIRQDLCQEAIRLGTLLVELLEKERFTALLPEARGLLALMLLHDSRRPARSGPDGELILLEEQDRDRWDQARIQAGMDLLDQAWSGQRVGPYQIQAAISAVHARAARAEDTDWGRIAAYYRVLEDMNPSPVVSLNHAIAIAMADGPERGLQLLDDLEAGGELHGYLPLYAARADLLRRAGRAGAALAAYQKAAQLSSNEAEQKYFRRRIAELSDPGG